MNKIRKKEQKYIIIALAFIMAFMMSFSGAFASMNGKTLQKSSHGGTHMFVTGDSRTYQIFAGSPSKPSYSGFGKKGAAAATWAGHYSRQMNGGYLIDSKSNKAFLKKHVVAELKKSGDAKIFVMATVNIANYGSSGYTNNVKGQLNTAKEYYGWTAKHGGKTVHPKVYCTSLVAWPGHSSSGYNKYLKSLCNKTSSVGYVAISCDGGYAPGDGHYNQHGANSIWNKLHATAGHYYGDWSVKTDATFSKNGTLVRKCGPCGKTDSYTVHMIKTVKLSKTSYNYDGSAKTPSVTAKDSKGKTIAKKYYTVSYANNKAIGTATATVKFKGRYSGTKKLTFKIKEVKATSISLNKTSVNLDKGKSVTLSATVSPSNTTYKTVTWSTSNANVAKVSAGKITAIKNGTATVTAKTKYGKIASCKVIVGAEGGTVNPSQAIEPTGVSLSKSKAFMVSGQTLNLIATVLPGNASNKTVTWTSSNSSVASVSAGQIIAKSSGTCIITAKTVNGKTASCTVTIV